MVSAGTRPILWRPTLLRIYPLPSRLYPIPDPAYPVPLMRYPLPGRTIPLRIYPLPRRAYPLHLSPLPGRLTEFRIYTTISTLSSTSPSLSILPLWVSYPLPSRLYTLPGRFVQLRIYPLLFRLYPSTWSGYSDKVIPSIAYPLTARACLLSF